MNTIQEQWQSFNRNVIPRSAGNAQRSEMELAFYSGADSVLRILLILSAKDITEQAAAQAVEGLHIECRQFARDYGRRRGLPDSVLDAIAPGPHKEQPERTS